MVGRHECCLGSNPSLQGGLGRPFRPDRPGRARAGRRGQSLMLVSHLPSAGPCEGGIIKSRWCAVIMPNFLAFLFHKGQWQNAGHAFHSAALTNQSSELTV